ncbi:HAMP domain-containing sensor histidine kinase [Clostridium subterminale]|uniref:histidine kinase n=1 Tax=Clostridium subterminale TaxID=1550 RepID=A0ABP3W2J8_CLOSU
MRLWQKIFLYTLALVILAISITSSLLLSNNHKLIIEREEKSALSEHEYLVSDIKGNVVYNRLKKSITFLSEEDVLNIIRNIFNNKDVKSSNILSIYKDGVRIFENNSLPFEIEEDVFEAIDKSKNHYLEIVDYKEASYMLIASQTNIEGKVYEIITTYDVTPIYVLYEEQINFIKSVSTLCGVIIAGVLIIIVRFLFSPLEKVNEGTRFIAEGNYNKRVEIKGNDEITELSMNMNIMAEAIEKNVEELEQVAEDRRIFIANLAHEMKTPLTSILGFADILRIKRVVNDAERQEYAGIIVEEAKRLKVLSGKLMELITVGNTDLDMEEVNIKNLADDIELSLTPILENRELNLKVEIEDIWLTIDKELFKSLVYNLIDNAIKASTVGQTISLIGKSNEEHVLIKVVDEGIGIPEDEIDHIIKPFYMVDKIRTRKNGGAGLGLALCVEIARLHNGTINIESEAGRGTCVCIDIRGGRMDEK